MTREQGIPTFLQKFVAKIQIGSYASVSDAVAHVSASAADSSMGGEHKSATVNAEACILSPPQIKPRLPR